MRFFLHSAVLDRKLVPTHRSMAYLPCLHVTGHIPFARGANVNIRFFLHSAILHRKLVPTHRSNLSFLAASQGHINGFLWASSAGNSYPKARSITSSGRSSVPFARHSQPTGIPRPHQWLLMGVQAFSGRSSVPFARHSQPTGIPRPHQWLLMGVQACRLPAPKPLKPSTPLKPSKPLKTLKTLKTLKHTLFPSQRRP